MKLICNILSLTRICNLRTYILIRKNVHSFYTFIMHPILTTIKCNLDAFYERWLTLNPSRVGEVLYFVVYSIVIYWYYYCCMLNVICLHYKCILSVENVYINKKTFFLLRECNVIILYYYRYKRPLWYKMYVWQNPCMLISLHTWFTM